MKKQIRPLVLFAVFAVLVGFFTTEVRTTFALIQNAFLGSGALEPAPQPGERYAPVYTTDEPVALADQDGGDAPPDGRGMDLQEIADLRAARVGRYAYLNLFPLDYNPLQGTRGALYKNIAPGADWLEDALLYLASPYSLITLSPARRTAPLNIRCRERAPQYTTGCISEALGGDGAQCFFEGVYGGQAPQPGSVQVSMVNAWDSGFRYASLDAARSRNIEPPDAAGTLYGGVCSYAARYHAVAGLGKNSIFPDNPRGLLRLRERGAPTTIAIKLWRDKPRAAADRADLVYAISVEP